jgi:predicted porin
MKRLSPLGPVLAALLAGLAATSAQAQSSVTAYGRLNLTIERQKDAADKTKTVMQNNSSRIGFKGTEDMGGGLKAGFQLESGFAADTGAAAATFWGRQSEVNLSGGFGMLRLGNYFSEAYYATADYISNHNHDTGTSADAFYAYLGRDVNKIAYRTPAMGPVTVELATSLHEQVNGTGGKNTYDLATNAQFGPLHLGAGYQKNDKANQFAIRAFYELGDFGLGAYYQRDEDGFGKGLGKRNNFRLSGMYTLGVSEFHLNYGHAGDYSNTPGRDTAANQFTVGYNYKLSKRTKVYGFYTKIDDKGTIYGDFSSFAVGIRHNF